MAKMSHPKGLYLLFALEMWERFSYYGMRALLMLYMTKYLLFDTEKAGGVYGFYTGFVYLTPIIGGFLADRYLGQRKTVLLGGIIMMLGHFTMAFPALPFFYTALTLLIIGNGLFKPNISTMVGQLYEKNDPRRDAGFTIFYMGINLGAFFSPLVCGTLGEKIGWHYGFGAAGVGMGIGLLLYLWGQKKYLGEIGMQPGSKVVSTDTQNSGPLSSEEKQRLLAVLFFTIFAIFFFLAFEQAGSSLTLFADRQTDRMLFGWEVPASYFQSINPALIFLLAPLFSGMWIRMAGKGTEPSTPMKFFYGLALVAISFVVMIPAAMVYQQSGPVSMMWLVGSYFFATLGELCLSPVGLSMVTKLAPARYGSMMMGVWLMSSFVANILGGIVAGNYENMPLTQFFMIPMAIAGGAAIVALFMSKMLKRWMHGVH